MLSSPPSRRKGLKLIHTKVAGGGNSPCLSFAGHCTVHLKWNNGRGRPDGKPGCVCVCECFCRCVYRQEDGATSQDDSHSCYYWSTVHLWATATHAHTHTRTQEFLRSPSIAWKCLINNLKCCTLPIIFFKAFVPSLIQDNGKTRKSLHFKFDHFCILQRRKKILIIT